MNRKDAGFSLIELIVTVAIAAIVLAIAVPSFAGPMQRAREANAYHLLTASLASARLRAVKDGTPVTVCPSSDGLTCRDDEVWRHGWIVYGDPDRNDQPRAGEAVFERVDGIGRGLFLRSTAGRKRVRYLPSGWAYGSNISIRLCRSGQDGFLGSVIVNIAGRARTQRQAEPSPCPFAAE